MIYKILERIRVKFDNVIALIDEGNYDEAKNICEDMRSSILGLVCLGKDKAQKTDPSGFNYEKFAAENFFGIPSEDMKPVSDQSGTHVDNDGYIHWDRVRLDQKNCPTKRAEDIEHDQYMKELEDIKDGRKHLNAAGVEDLMNKMLDYSKRQREELEELSKKSSAG